MEYREPYGANNSPNSDGKIQINLLISSIVQIKLLSHAAMNGQKIIARSQSQRRIFATKHIASLGLQSLQPDRIKRRPFASVASRHVVGGEIFQAHSRGLGCMLSEHSHCTMCTC